MKITPLLAQYLYAHKQLNLPGIGTFILDPQAVTEPENSKRPQPLTHIHFENNPSLRDLDPELISYVSLNTGKMKSLAQSDLESHIELALQFLNMGKPFLFEGIGTLLRLRPGEYSFTPGIAISERIPERTQREENTKPESEKTETYSGSFFTEKKRKPAYLRPLIGVLLLSGLGIAIYGGYRLSKNKRNISVMEMHTDSVVSKDTTTQQQPSPDTAAIIPPGTATPAAQIDAGGTYKYVVEKAAGKRAFDRYNKLKSYQWPIQMETRDSVVYTLFLRIPTAGADTTRILDSLTALNGKRVYIEP
ncbi:MAG: hypothetical protein J0G98_13285 [Terrimonas ferruginea]|uniref:hypothetical protein n=1 Tax=Terrimonas ferruginea TaxID=249 RepID=UPI000B0D23CC|nr:hypothetical protein [Terrimonas ferruginea]MBN8784029.1 hypothetical protein [Terrimonas ferruginea]